MSIIMMSTNVPTMSPVQDSSAPSMSPEFAVAAGIDDSDSNGEMVLYIALSVVVACIIVCILAICWYYCKIQINKDSNSVKWKYRVSMICVSSNKCLCNLKDRRMQIIHIKNTQQEKEDMQVHMKLNDEVEPGQKDLEYDKRAKRSNHEDVAWHVVDTKGESEYRNDRATSNDIVGNVIDTKA